MPRPRKIENTLTQKLCVRCGRVLPLSQFYANRDWKEQIYHDAWCKECFQKLVKTKDDLIQYCYENNRMWEDEMWETSQRAAYKNIIGDKQYSLPTTSSAIRQEIETRHTIKMFAALMNHKSIYHYVNNIKNDPPQPSGDDEEEEKEELVYSDEWQGYYTKADIERLDKKYARYEEDFVLDNINIQDYAHKIVKASFDADVAQDKMRRGVGEASTYKDMQKIFDDMSKSATFAACRRKAGDSSGLGSLGEIILRLEIDGKLEDKGFEFPKDDVDKIIADFRHTLAAVGAEGGF